MKCNLAVIKGDGIGPEIVTEAMKVLDKVGEVYGHTFDYAADTDGWMLNRCNRSTAYR